jgi:hypothetical protein
MDGLREAIVPLLQVNCGCTALLAWPIAKQFRLQETLNQMVSLSVNTSGIDHGHTSIVSGPISIR